MSEYDKFEFYKMQEKLDMVLEKLYKMEYKLSQLTSQPITYPPFHTKPGDWATGVLNSPGAYPSLAEKEPTSLKELYSHDFVKDTSGDWIDEITQEQLGAAKAFNPGIPGKIQVPWVYKPANELGAVVKGDAQAEALGESSGAQNKFANLLSKLKG